MFLSSDTHNHLTDDKSLSVNRGFPDLYTYVQNTSFVNMYEAKL